MPGHFTFYSNKIEGDIAWFSETEAKHAIQVLRYQVGDGVHFSDGIGNVYEGEIVGVTKKEFSARILKKLAVERPAELRLFMGVLKAGDRMEWAVEKCTELGITEINFVSTKNSERSKINLERMNKVALSAMKQSHGAYFPKIQQLGFAEALEYSSGLEGEKTIAYCDFQSVEEVKKVRQLTMPISVFIGPEGDFTKEEVEKCKENGWKIMMLGNQILRSETACVSVVAALRMLHS